MATNEVWVLGATGRAGRMIAARLHAAGVSLVLVGRDQGRLERVAVEVGGAPRLVVGELDETLARLAQDAPAVVVNTIGPFTTTATQVARACPKGTHYVDIANELAAVESILDLDRRAVAADQVLVTGAGFGVLATESVVLRLCEGEPRPSQVRVDALASVATDGGALGPALAGTVVEILASGGREVRDGRLVRAAVGAHPVTLSTPDGDVLPTGSGPSGELIAAWRASDADFVIAASFLTPTGALVRVLPAISAILRIPGVRRLVTSAIARVPLHAGDRPRASSWAHARVWWPSGTVRDGWLQTGEGHEFTAAVAAEVTQRLLLGDGRPGAFTPGALFGAGLAEAAGGTLFSGQAISPTPMKTDRGIRPDTKG
ncbi:saccharopine dehydrogenase NADP-binding domain-containing protein [Mycobacterium sp. DL592]|uniref:saccharopine dehydrogenase NADP-binding domain-containing protein n=1 Tax=Mycobacterium sp. DL592 TaxID=2675524 RepID=UPI00141E58DF|nr:saccharopine dehydrogenase NADP-binding domain-containing protein [Mycobacterium sp. DL592]